MTSKKWINFIFIYIFIILTMQNLWAISPAEKSEKNYVLAIKTIRNLRIIIENFGTKEQKEKFNNITKLFQKASERHYAQEFAKPTSYTGYIKQDNNYQSSVDMFLEFKVKVNLLYDEIVKQYIDRSKKILDSTSEKATQVIIKFGKNSGMAKYFYEPVNPLTDSKPYKSSEYHYFHERQKIEAYLKNGYKYWQDARNIYNNTDFDYIRNKKIKKSTELNYMIEQYNYIIDYTRQSKQYGIEIHKILNNTELTNIVRKYSITTGTVNRFPVYDDRIPSEFKVDSIDNKKMLYKVELERVKNYNKKNSN